MEAQVADLRWRKSSFSGNGGNCVEVAGHGGTVLVRDTKQNGAGLVQAYDAEAWRAFIAELKAS